MAKKKKRRWRKNKLKQISENQIIKINLDYTDDSDEENKIDLRGNRHYLVTSFKEVKEKKVVIEMCVITTRDESAKKKFLRREWLLQHKIKKLPKCLNKPSLINQHILITLRLELNKCQRHLCYCRHSCFDSEEYVQIVNDREEYWNKHFGKPFLKPIDLEI